MCIYIYIYLEREKKRERERESERYVCVCIYIYVYIYIYTHNVVTRSAAPPPPPPWSMVQDAPLLWDGVWVPSSPVGWLWGFWGFGSSLSFRVLGLGLGLKGTRLQVDKGLGRVWGVGSL